MYKLGGWQLSLDYVFNCMLSYNISEVRGREMKRRRRRRRMMRYRGGWSHYYMHGAVPIMQYTAASTQFNPLSQQIIMYI